MGVAIRSGTSFELIKPTIDDLFEDTVTRMYTYKRDGVTLTTDSRKDFLYATKDYAKLEKGRKDEEAKVCALIASSFSEETKMQLRTNSAYIQAANDNNSFQMYTIAKADHTRATSFIPPTPQLEDDLLFRRVRRPTSCSKRLLHCHLRSGRYWNDDH